MASLNAAFRAGLERSRQYQLIPSSQQGVWLRKCLEIGERDSQKPGNGEQFDSVDHCWLRIRQWQFVEDLNFVIGKTRSDRTPSKEFRCKAYGSIADKNNGGHSGLESRVKRDEKGNITSIRQRDTKTEKAGCPARYMISYKLVDKKDINKERVWIGRWMDDSHTDDCPYSESINPLTVERNLEMLDEYRALITQAQMFRTGQISHQKAQQMMTSTGNPLFLNSKKYYNLVQQFCYKTERDDTIRALIRVLDEKNWKYEIRTRDLESGERQLVQIIFWGENWLRYIHRFSSDGLVYIDSTFRTNIHACPLMIAVGVSNCNSTVPIAFSWCPEEDKESYEFMLQVLKGCIYTDVPGPATFLTDQSGGFKPAFATGIFPLAKHQLCNWHVHEAIVNHFKQVGRYTKAEREGGIESATGEEYLGLNKLTWNWILSNNQADLDTNREALKACLQPAEQRYIDNYHDREQQFISFYTKNLRNYGYGSTQRVESLNSTIHNVVHRQLTLERAANSIIQHAETMLNTYESLLTESRTKAYVSITSTDISTLSRKITHHALKELDQQWLRLATELPPCTDRYTQQYHLPCVHYLFQASNSRDGIQSLLIHPRWLIAGHIQHQLGWKPQISRLEVAQNPIQRLIPERLTNQALFQQILDRRDRMNTNEQRGYDEKVTFALQKLIELGDIAVTRSQNHPLLPQNIARFQPVIPILSTQLNRAANIQVRRSAQENRDIAILAARAATQVPTPSITTTTTRTIQEVRTIQEHVQVQENKEEDFTAQAGTDIDFLIPDSQPNISIQDQRRYTTPPAVIPPVMTTQDPIPTDFEPPLSTAPPCLQEEEATSRRKRSRALSSYPGLYNDLNNGRRRR